MIELLRKRRSIRKYRAEKIPAEKIKILKEALMRSPSSRNFNPWRFIFIQDEDMLTKLSASKPHGATFLKNASLGIVVCGDSRESDVWIEDCSIASILVQLTAQSLSLGSCWIQIRNRKYDDTRSSESYIQELLRIPEQVKIESIISLGYPAQEIKGVPYENLDFTKIYMNTF